MVSGFSEGRIVFDSWLESSLKNKKQKKKIYKTCWVPDTSGNEAHHVHQGPSVIVKVQKHAGHFIRQWIISMPLQQHSHQAGRGLRYNKIRYPNCEEEHTHEEADTLITNQVLRSIDEHLSQDICVVSAGHWRASPAAWLGFKGRHGNLNSHKFFTGKTAN